MSHKFYKPAKSRLQRSELAVPGSSPKMFEKALNSKADYVFLDLEDAVSPNDKISARANVIKALNEINWRENGKTISVRIFGTKYSSFPTKESSKLTAYLSNSLSIYSLGADLVFFPLNADNKYLASA